MGSTNGKRVIKFQSVDPERNRYRHYELETEALGLLVRVKRSWGRAGGKKRQLVTYVGLADAEREVRNLLRVRARHGYEIGKARGKKMHKIENVVKENRELSV